MKRLFTTLLVAILLVTSLTIAASAAGTVVQPGDSSALYVTVSNSNGFNYFTAKVTVDPTLTVTGASGGMINHVVGNTVYFEFDSTENVTSKTLTISVKVSDTAAPGTYGATSVSATGATVIVPGENGAAGTVEYTSVSAGCSTVVIEEPKCEHTLGGWVYDDANHWKECSKCHQKFESAAHTLDVTDSATCGKDGVKTSKCSICGYSHEESSTATGKHDYQLISDTATCGKDGVKTYKCSVCGDTYEEVSKATGKHDHKLVSDTATCGKDGVKTYKCSVCGDTYEEVSKATGKHDYQLVSDTATCGKDGVKTYKCSVCGDTYEEVSKATGEHTWATEWSTDKDNHWHVCSVCGEKNDHGAHVFKWVIDKKATATQTGLKHEECETCNYKRNIGTVIPKVEDLDDVPQTGDITPYITMGFLSMISLLAAAAYVLKRKFAK